MALTSEHRGESVGSEPREETYVLVVADAGRESGALESALSRRGYVVNVATTATQGYESLAKTPARLVVVVLPLRSARSGEVFPKLRTVDGGAVLVAVGTDADVASAGDAFELGVQDYLPAVPADTSDFLATVGVLLGERRGDRHLQYLRAKEGEGASWNGVIGESPALQRVLAALRQVSLRGGAPSILLNGETGTGKGYAAKCVHYNGVRRNRPFVEVNCAALPPGLIESELFGYERGAFTDAKSSRAGLFETADGGTLFLDEIGAIPIDLQAKLLTAIEEKKVRRIGGRQSVRFDVQIVAATHEDLPRKVKEGSFREDLFHRLNVVAVVMPALRDRGEDVVVLGEYFLKSLCREYGMPTRKLSAAAREWMTVYPWPGNVRELRNQIERVVLLENDEFVRAEHFGTYSDGALSVNIATSGPGGTKLQVSLPPNGVPLGLLEREVLREALARCEGNVSRAARFLSISRQTLMYRMKKHGLGDAE